jgi:hypothetical protein
MISVFFIGIIAAPTGQKKTICHNNFRYYWQKIPICIALIEENIGVPDPLKGKLVYT